MFDSVCSWSKALHDHEVKQEPSCSFAFICMRISMKLLIITSMYRYWGAQLAIQLQLINSIYVVSIDMYMYAYRQLYTCMREAYSTELASQSLSRVLRELIIKYKTRWWTGRHSIAILASQQCSQLQLCIDTYCAQYNKQFTQLQLAIAYSFTRTNESMHR